MHTFYSNKNQPYIYGNYSLFVAEVASNFNQAMVRDYLFRTQLDHAFQLALIEETMSNFHRYFFIMPILAQWEHAMHERVEQGKAINADIMIKTCTDLFKEGYGDFVEFDEEQVGITWAQFPHMYANYYVYQYTTGISGAHALLADVATNKGNAVQKYLAFLSAGSSMYPVDALKMVGVDLTSPEPVEKAFYFLAKVIDQLDNLFA
jgi:oligoendopeptidase F